MIRSLRWRLQIWHAVILGLVVLSLGASFYVQLRHSTLREIDAELLSGARMLEGALRTLSPRLPGSRPPRPSESDGERPRQTKGRPRSPSGARLPPLEELLDVALRLPPTRSLGPQDSPDYFVVFASDGKILRAEPKDLQMLYSEPFRSLEYRFKETRREVWVRGPSSTVIVVGRDTQSHLSRLNEWLINLIAGGATIWFFGLLGGWWLSGSAVRPITAISQTAGRISAENLSQRIETAHLDRELNELATILNSMLQRLEDSFRQQSQFIADASHELRTPISVLLSHCELALNRTRSTEEYQHTLTICQRAAGRMRSLIEGLLLLVRADAGKLNLRSEQIDLHALACEAVGMLQPFASEHSVDLIATGTTARCYGDESCIAQVVTNLVNNAIIYNRPGGTVSVTTSVENGKAILKVEDSGIGIPHNSITKVFDRFYRVEEARSRATGGAGLGLAICKSIVEAHQGDLSVSSQPGIGSIFELRLPPAPQMADLSRSNDQHSTNLPAN